MPPTYGQPISFTGGQADKRPSTRNPFLGRERLRARFTLEQLNERENLFKKDHSPAMQMRKNLSNDTRILMSL